MGGPSPLQFLTLAVAATTIGVAVYIIYTRAQDPPPRRRRPRKSGRPSQRILFYHRHEPHFGFTNFAEYPVEYEGRIYPTSEHLFQAFKVWVSLSTHHALSTLLPLSSFWVIGLT
jgi:hypothetical protein